MQSILVLTHADETGSALTKASLEAVTAGVDLAARLGAELAIGIVAKHASHAAAQVAGAANRLLAVQGEAFAQARFASDAAACTEICRAAMPTIVVAPDSSRFARVMAVVARSHGRRHRHAYRCARHAHYGHRRRGSRRGDTMVLPPADRSGHHARQAAVVSASGCRHARALRR